MILNFLESKIGNRYLTVFDIIIEVVLKVLHYWRVVEIDECIMGTEMI